MSRIVNSIKISLHEVAVNRGLWHGCSATVHGENNPPC